MKKAVGCAAWSCAFGLAHAKALKWSEDGPKWVPAQETPQAVGVMLALTMDPPMPTPAPPPSKVKSVLKARGSTDNTCGFVSGIPTSSLWCAETAQCVYNSINSHIGCCDDTTTNCPVWTTCYDSTDRDSFTTDNGRTLWCGASSYPYCWTHLYQDDVLSDYTLLGCGVAAGTGQIWYSSTPTRSSTPITDPSSTTSDDVSSTSSTTSDIVTTTSAAPPPPSDSSTNIGAIVGGVVGGVAALGLIGLGAWLLMRMNRKQKEEEGAAQHQHQHQHQQQPPSHPNAAITDPHMSQLPPQHQHQQPPYYTAAAAAAPAGYAKPPHGHGHGHNSVAYSTTTTSGGGGYDQSTIVGSSPPGSPPPPSVGYQNVQGTPSPPPQQQQQQGQGQFGQQQQFGGFGEQQGQGGYAGQQGQQGQQFGGGGGVSPGTVSSGGYQHQQQQGYGYAAELPAQRGDGELRELGG